MSNERLIIVVAKVTEEDGLNYNSSDIATVLETAMGNTEETGLAVNDLTVYTFLASEDFGDLLDIIKKERGMIEGI